MCSSTLPLTSALDVPGVQRTGWAPGPVWTVTENLVPRGIRPLDRPASTELDQKLKLKNNHQRKPLISANRISFI
jgi:hypothetical protein